MLAAYWTGKLEIAHRSVNNPQAETRHNQVFYLLVAGSLISAPPDGGFAKEVELENKACTHTQPSSPKLIFGEKVFQISFRKAACETFLAEHVSNRLGFALLEIPNLLFNRPRGNETIGVDGLGLTNTVRAINRLGFNRGVPPRIIEHDITSSRQIQTGSSCA